MGQVDILVDAANAVRNSIKLHIAELRKRARQAEDAEDAEIYQDRIALAQCLNSRTLVGRAMFEAFTQLGEVAYSWDGDTGTLTATNAQAKYRAVFVLELANGRGEWNFHWELRGDL